MNDASAPHRPGTRLGPYEIVSQIGGGGMGHVYRARDSRLNRDVALKVMPEEFAADRPRLKRFTQEARAASSLSHPNIVTVFEVGESESRSYIAMELVEGQTLRSLLRPGGIPLRKLLDVAVQIADGLARAHEVGIVHRDVKPENVMVSSEGVVKILDFGLAKLTRSSLERGAAPEEGTLPLPTRPGVLIGTVRYMSPEQAAGSTVDFRADQFAFGSVLYEMASGRPAFRGDTTVDTLSAILHDEPEPLGQLNPKLPPPLRWIVERCLAKDPNDRYVSTRDLARDLWSLKQHASEASLSGVEATPRPARRRVPALAGVVALAVLLVIAGLLVGRSLGKRPPPRFQQITFRSAGISSARFTPDGESVVYSAHWEGKRPELFETRLDQPETRPMGLQASQVLSISRAGEMAILGPSYGSLLRSPQNDLTVRDPRLLYGTLARVPLAGGMPREILDDVLFADWAPNGQDLAVVHLAGRKNRVELPIGHVLYEDDYWLSDLRVSPKGDWIAFANSGRSLVLMDSAGRVRPWHPGVSWLSWSPGGWLWYTALSSGTTAIHAARPDGDDRLVASLAGNFGLYDIAPDGRLLLGQIVDTVEILGSFPGVTPDRNFSNFDRSELLDVSAAGDVILFREIGRVGDILRPVLYIRRTDGSPAKRLGEVEGDGGRLSADAKLVLVPGAKGLELVPTGAGQPVPIETPGVEAWNAAMFPDGKRICFMGRLPGHLPRIFVQDIPAGRPRAISPEGARRPIVSGDGRYVCGRDSTGFWSLYPADEGTASRVAGLLPGEEPFQWTADGKLLYVRGADEPEPGEPVIPARVYRLDPWSGRRELWKEIPPLSPTTGGGIGAIRFAADGRICFYNHHRYSSDLFVAEGLK